MTTFKGVRRPTRMTKPDTKTKTVDSTPKQNWKKPAARAAGSISTVLRGLTSRWLGVLWLSLLMVYFTGVSLENYWQSFPFLGGERPPFMPKLWVPDGADLGVLQRIWTEPVFWIALVFCLGVQVIEANFLRAKSGSSALAKKGETKKANFGRVANKAKGSWFVLAVVAYAVDIWTTWQQFPVTGTDQLSPFVCWFWFICSLMAPEILGNAIIYLMEHPEDED